MNLLVNETHAIYKNGFNFFNTDDLSVDACGGFVGDGQAGACLSLEEDRIRHRQNERYD